MTIMTQKRQFLSLSFACLCISIQLRTDSKNTETIINHCDNHYPNGIIEHQEVHSVSMVFVL